MEKIYEKLIDKCILNLPIEDKKGVLETWKKYRNTLVDEDKPVVTRMIKWLVASTKKKKKKKSKK